MTEHYVRLGAETFPIHMTAECMPFVHVAPGRPKWSVERLGPRTFKFSRVVRGKVVAFVDSLPMPVAPDPVIPFFGKKRRAHWAQKASA